MRVQPVDRISMYGIKYNRFKTIQQTKNLYNLIFTNNKENEIWLVKAKRKVDNKGDDIYGMVDR